MQKKTKKITAILLLLQGNKQELFTFLVKLYFHHVTDTIHHPYPGLVHPADRIYLETVQSRWRKKLEGFHPLLQHLRAAEDHQKA